MQMNTIPQSVFSYGFASNGAIRKMEEILRTKPVSDFKAGNLPSLNF